MHHACNSSPYCIVKPWSKSLTPSDPFLEKQFSKEIKKDLDLGLTQKSHVKKSSATNLAQKIDKVDSKIKYMGSSYMIKEKVTINTNF